MASNEKNTTGQPKDGQSGTTPYSATQAPENRPHVESSAPPVEATLKPGGAHGSPVDVGMSELYHETVPSGASDLELTHYGENPAEERKHSGRE
jgi:hypothetical protein